MLLNMEKVRQKIWLLGEETFLNFDAYILPCPNFTTSYILSIKFYYYYFFFFLFIYFFFFFEFGGGAGAENMAIFMGMTIFAFCYSQTGYVFS